MYYLAAALYLCICIVLENAAAGFALKSQYGLMSRRCSVGKHLPGNQCDGDSVVDDDDDDDDDDDVNDDGIVL